MVEEAVVNPYLKNNVDVLLYLCAGCSKDQRRKVFGLSVHSSMHMQCLRNTLTNIHLDVYKDELIETCILAPTHDKISHKCLNCPPLLTW